MPVRVPLQEHNFAQRVPVSLISLNWTCTVLAVFVFRFSATGLYLYALLFWRHELETLPLHSQLVYHVLGVIFTCVNLVWAAILWGYRIRDSAWLDKALGLDIRYCDAPAEQDHGTPAESQLPQFSEEDIQAHNRSDSCWIVIQGNVYDVTSFLQAHPGGAAVLLENAGKDASNAFAQVRVRLRRSHMRVGGSMKAGWAPCHLHPMSCAIFFVWLQTGWPPPTAPCQAVWCGVRYGRIVQWIGVEWSVVEWHGVHWSGVECSRVE